MAGWRQGQPARVRAPQRRAARKSPGRAPFLSRPRRSSGKLAAEANGRNEPRSPCPAVDAVLATMVIGSLWDRFSVRKFAKCSKVFTGNCQEDWTVRWGVLATLTGTRRKAQFRSIDRPNPEVMVAEAVRRKVRTRDDSAAVATALPSARSALLDAAQRLLRTEGVA